MLPSSSFKLSFFPWSLVSPLHVPQLVYMSRLNTRPSNKNKHPGVVDLSLQRCTHGQKKANEEKTVEEKQAREETQKAGICRLAEVEEHDRQTLNTLMGPGPGPRAMNKWKRLETGSKVAAATRMGTGAEKNGPPVIKDKAAGSNDAVNMGSNIDREEEKRGKVKKTRAERAMYHNEVEAEKTQGQSDAGNEDDDLSNLNEKDGISGPHNSAMTNLGGFGQFPKLWVDRKYQLHYVLGMSDQAHIFL
ncbi:hypothetical protein H4582DRAFT_2058382 [Lactarius indigo]|nr:hypothetical protein H4582DRAFT_2058382 [Lactarius indigo]